MNRYRVTGARAVLGVEPGDLLEHEFTIDEETAHLAAGRLQVLPAAYLVVGDRQVHETDPGGTFEAALPGWQRDALITGGHITPVPTAQPAAAKKRGRNPKE